jgi:hypothetical protein
MGVKFDYLRDRKENVMVRADRRLWETADRSRVVEDGDPEAAFLLCIPGDEIPEEQAKRYGLLKGNDAGPREEPTAEGKPSESADEQPAAEEQQEKKAIEPHSRRKQRR